MPTTVNFKLKFGDPSSFVAYLDRCKYDYFYRSTKDFVDIVCGDTRFFFPLSNNFKNVPLLSRMVKRDFELYLKHNKVIVTEPAASHINVKSSLENENIVAYDINHAYWRVAFVKGYITETTYLKGLSTRDLKNSYCIALSTQGAAKKYSKLNSGKNKGSAVTMVNERFRDIYTDIRNSTYRMMDDLRFELGCGFRGYTVDCIYCIDNEKNRTKVEAYLIKNKMQFKKELLTKNK